MVMKVPATAIKSLAKVLNAESVDVSFENVYSAVGVQKLLLAIVTSEDYRGDKASTTYVLTRDGAYKLDYL